MPPNMIAELKTWDSVHVGLIGSYSNYIRQKYPGGVIIKNNVSLTWMTIIDPTTGWLEIFNITTYDINEVTGGNCEYINKSSAGFSQLFNTTRISRYQYTRKVMIDNGSELKKYFSLFLRYFDIKPVLTTTKTHKLTLQWIGCIK